MPSNEIEYEVSFTDRTICESGGIFDEVLFLMKSEEVYNDKWCLRSGATISSPLGMSDISLMFDNEKKIYILDYHPAIGDVFYNPDIQILTAWAHEHGWMTPEPIQSVVEDDLEFWKHFWLTHLVDSDYLSNVYGKRDTSYEDDIKDREDVIDD